MPPAIQSRIMRSARAGILVGRGHQARLTGGERTQGRGAGSAQEVAAGKAGCDVRVAMRCSSRFMSHSVSIKILEIRMHKEAPEEVLQGCALKLWLLFARRR